ncbi:MAG: hypothetical protein U0792_16405 [Gemmataceae bacterium]
MITATHHTERSTRTGNGAPPWRSRLGLASTGCRQKMSDQPYYRPYQESDFFYYTDPNGEQSTVVVAAAEVGVIHRAQYLDSDPLVTGLTPGRMGPRLRPTGEPEGRSRGRHADREPASGGHAAPVRSASRWRPQGVRRGVPVRDHPR